jgi:hypothetical protein
VRHIFSRDVLRRIKDQDASWEDMVPQEIAAVIKRRSFFGYRSTGESMDKRPAPPRLFLNLSRPAFGIR